MQKLHERKIPEKDYSKLDKLIVDSLYEGHSQYVDFSRSSHEFRALCFEEISKKRLKINSIAGGKVSVELKDTRGDEKKGSFATPNSIANIVVKQAIGDQLERRKPVNELKIIDPSCGSGTFLIQAYHNIKKHIISNAEKSGNNEIIENIDCKFYDKPIKLLCLEECSKIMRESIYGRDISSSSTILTRYSLHLEYIDEGRVDGRDQIAILPDISNNIKVGNALATLSDPHHDCWEGHIDATHYPERYDIVVGNPPFISNRKISGTPDDSELKKQKKYIIMKWGERYGNLGSPDLSTFFLLLALDIVKRDGTISMLQTPSTYSADFGKIPRRLTMAHTSRLIRYDGKRFSSKARVVVPLISMGLDYVSVDVWDYSMSSLSLKGIPDEEGKHSSAIILNTEGDPPLIGTDDIVLDEISLAGEMSKLNSLGGKTIGDVEVLQVDIVGSKPAYDALRALYAIPPSTRKKHRAMREGCFKKWRPDLNLQPGSRKKPLDESISGADMTSFIDTQSETKDRFSNMVSKEKLLISQSSGEAAVCTDKEAVLIKPFAFAYPVNGGDVHDLHKLCVLLNSNYGRIWRLSLPPSGRGLVRNFGTISCLNHLKKMPIPDWNDERLLRASNLSKRFHGLSLSTRDENESDYEDTINGLIDTIYEELMSDL